MRLISYPSTSAEPVSTGEAKLACRLDDALDVHLPGLLSAAREQAEQITGRAYRAKVLREELEDWPTEPLALPAYQAEAVAISYRSAASPDAWTPLAGTVSRWYALGAQTVIRLADGQTWPDLATEDYGTRVRIDVTVPAASPFPESVRSYILAHVAGWVDAPGALIDGRLQANPHHERLLDGERTRW